MFFVYKTWNFSGLDKINSVVVLKRLTMSSQKDVVIVSGNINNKEHQYVQKQFILKNRQYNMVQRTTM